MTSNPDEMQSFSILHYVPLFQWWCLLLIALLLYHCMICRDYQNSPSAWGTY